MPRRRKSNVGVPTSHTAVRRAFVYKRRIVDAEIVAAIVRHRGKLSYVAEEVGVSVRVIKTHMAQNPDIADKVDDYTERLLDKVLSKAEEMVDYGNTAVVMQLLKMLGGRKEIGERLIVEGGSNPIRTENVTRVDLSNLSVEERRVLLKAYRRVAPREGDPDYDPSRPATNASQTLEIPEGVDTPPDEEDYV